MFAFVRAMLTLGVVLVTVAGPSALAQAPATEQGKVKVEWLGHEFYRFTSPKGVVIITCPFASTSG